MMKPRGPSLGRRGLLTALGAAALASPSLARAQAPHRWRMVTSWPRNLAGPGVSARRLAERITKMSGGRLEVEVFAAGEIVPALSVFDAVSTGVAEMAHTASFYWIGKLPASIFFTTAPFGLDPTEHQAWIFEGGGQGLWDELYAPFGLKGFLAGNTGPSMGGWFRSEVKGLSDMRGLRIRVQGVGAEVYARLGATPVTLAPGDLEPALERGAIDAAELLAPVNDVSLELQRQAKFYYAPGFNKPNGAAEALVSRAAFDALPDDLRAVIANACEAEHSAGLADAERGNAEAIEKLGGDGVRVSLFPADVLTAARAAARDVISETAAKDALSGRIVESYRAALDHGRYWASLQAAMTRSLKSA
ncbi:MAG: TRAP transporter substrate-binding protein [Hyphomicrobiales bacterium]|nr:TRAP transporter substrate-binding protein [Hyphomicrobiales bacterium]